MQYWLIKSEPSVFSIDDLQREKTTLWDGVRNYQARNFLQAMELGDKVLYYHSNEDPIGVVGVAQVIKIAVPDPTQFDSKSKYFDEGVSKEKPRWFAPTIAFQEKFHQVVTRDILQAERALQDLLVLRKGNRLSVLPVTQEEYLQILELGKGQ